jgi:hypothetical protein
MPNIALIGSSRVLKNLDGNEQSCRRSVQPGRNIKSPFLSDAIDLRWARLQETIDKIVFVAALG